jgi:hypothetical protein
MSQKAIDHAMTRLVAPVVRSRLTRVGAALIPGTPINPPTRQPTPGQAIRDHAVATASAATVAGSAAHCRLRTSCKTSASFGKLTSKA